MVTSAATAQVNDGERERERGVEYYTVIQDWAKVETLPISSLDENTNSIKRIFFSFHENSVLIGSIQNLSLSLQTCTRQTKV